MVDRTANVRGDRLREVDEKYEMLNGATRDRLREITSRIQALLGKLDAADDVLMDHGRPNERG
jgi:hypothetical protein